MAEEGAKISCHGISNHTATTSSESSFQDVEENMLIEILSRLPTAASAIRLKVVCKRWCSLISTPYFIKTFVDFHNRYHDSDKYRDADDDKYQKPFGFLLTHLYPHVTTRHPNCALAKFSRNSCFDFQDFSLSRNLPEKKKRDVIALTSCNDLIMCVSWNLSYFLCNPFTKQWVALPSPPLVTRIFFPISEFGLLCEPYCCGDVMKSPCRYRIVHFCYSCKYEPGNLIAAETYYSETGQWVESDPLGEFRQHIMASNIVAYNGKLCWVDAGSKFLVTYDPFNMGHRGGISLVGDGNLYQPDDNDVYRMRIGVSEGVLRIIKVGNINGPYSHRQYSHRQYGVWDLEEVMVGSDEWRLRLKHEGKDMDGLCNEGATHPTNKDVVYFYSVWGDTYTEYNMESREFKPVNFRKLCSDYECKIFPVELPWWPTPLLAIR